jgi:hypothetical protein
MCPSARATGCRAELLRTGVAGAAAIAQPIV